MTARSPVCAGAGPICASTHHQGTLHALVVGIIGPLKPADKLQSTGRWQPVSAGPLDAQTTGITALHDIETTSSTRTARKLACSIALTNRLRREFATSCICLQQSRCQGRIILTNSFYTHIVRLINSSARITDIAAAAHRLPVRCCCSCTQDQDGTRAQPGSRRE